MKIIVTGGMGFLGTHTCKLFEGQDVIAVDNLTKYELDRTGYDSDLARNYNFNNLTGKDTTFIKEDIRNKKAMEKICKDADYIINCAAQPAMTIAIENPMLDYSTNITGLLNLLEIARKQDIPIAHCSSIHVYGNGINDHLEMRRDCFYHEEKNSFSEKEPLLTGSLSPLHASKRAGEIYCQTYIDTYGLKVMCLRLSGMYGTCQFGGEDHGWVANFAIRTVMNKPITIYGSHSQVRDILYVEDAIKLFELFFFNQKEGTYNVGGGSYNAISLKECIDKLANIIGRKQEIIYKDQRYGDLWWFVSDNTKVYTTFKWQPKVTPNEGILKLVEWISINKNIFEEKG